MAGSPATAQSKLGTQTGAAGHPTVVESQKYGQVNDQFTQFLGQVLSTAALHPSTQLGSEPGLQDKGQRGSVAWSQV